ncbi:hypothetical protein BS47DRAFT_1398353 [Hydnum rufescens UP504]|uniref:Uncharacterized protein n=1 Tax=Hydnum rufescens UP504 TaxID=1448309 RepID=A0A9P6DNB2_9AGAM|nr:hypothetical protein BS47DRAFT_1398353 [Hydnum rufescens UP504]
MIACCGVYDGSEGESPPRPPRSSRALCAPLSLLSPLYNPRFISVKHQRSSTYRLKIPAIPLDFHATRRKGENFCKGVLCTRAHIPEAGMQDTNRYFINWSAMTKSELLSTSDTAFLELKRDTRQSLADASMNILCLPMQTEELPSFRVEE